MKIMYDKLITFIENELKTRGWSHRELARRAGVSQTSVSGTLAGQRSPGADFCLKLAKALGEPPEKMLRLAGLLPSVPILDGSPEIQEFLEIARNMSPNTRQQALKYLRFLYENEEDENIEKVANVAAKSGISTNASRSANLAGKDIAITGESFEELLDRLSQDRRRFFEAKFKRELSEEIDKLVNAADTIGE